MCILMSRWPTFLKVSRVKLGKVWKGLEGTRKAKNPAQWSVKLNGPLRKRDEVAHTPKILFQMEE